MIAEAAPGPPLNTKVTGRSTSLSAMYETEKISAAGFSFLRRTVQFALAAYSIDALAVVQVPVVCAPAGGS